MPSRTTAPAAAPYTTPLYRLHSPCALGEAQHLGDHPTRTLQAGTTLYVFPRAVFLDRVRPEPIAVELVADVEASIAGVAGAVEAALVFASAEPGRYVVVRARYADLDKPRPVAETPVPLELALTF